MFIRLVPHNQVEQDGTVRFECLLSPDPDPHNDLPSLGDKSRNQENEYILLLLMYILKYHILSLYVCTSQVYYHKRITSQDQSKLTTG